jgi:hypothetical protein
MKVAIQPLEGKDLHDGFAKLRYLVYPHTRFSLDASVWRWLESNTPVDEKMYRWVLVNEETEVVGHLAATPQYYRVGGRRIVAHTPTDYMVLPKYGFHALRLMREFFRSTQNCVACDLVPAVIRIESQLGAPEAGKLHYAMKVLDVSKLSLLPAATPAPIPRLLNRGLQLVDKALSRGFGSKFNVEVLDGFDESFDELFEKVAAAVPCLPEKGTAFLRWRYGPGSPQAPVTVLGVRGEEGILGYAVLRVTSTDPKEGYLLDLTTLPGRHEVARALLREVISHFRVAGVYRIRYYFLKSPTAPLLEDLRILGFYFEKGKLLEELASYFEA